jgi:hypothetical protein
MGRGQWHFFLEGMHRSLLVIDALAHVDATIHVKRGTRHVIGAGAE